MTGSGSLREPYRVAPEDIGNLDVGNVLFMSAANDGAMGEPGMIYLANEDGIWYQLNDFELTEEQLMTIPVIREVFFSSDAPAQGDWRHWYMGMGNNLFVHKDVAERFAEKIGEMGKIEIYQHWMYTAMKILEERKAN